MKVVFDTNIFVSAFVLLGSLAEKAILKIMYEGAGREWLVWQQLVIGSPFPNPLPEGEGVWLLDLADMCVKVLKCDWLVPSPSGGGTRRGDEICQGFIAPHFLNHTKRPAEYR